MISGTFDMLQHRCWVLYHGLEQIYQQSRPFLQMKHIFPFIFRE